MQTEETKDRFSLAKCLNVGVAARELGETTLALPLGGTASNDPRKLRSPLLAPFWLLAAALFGSVLLYLCLRILVFY